MAKNTKLVVMRQYVNQTPVFFKDHNTLSTLNFSPVYKFFP